MVMDAAILQFPAVHKKCPAKSGYQRTKINRKPFCSQVLPLSVLHVFLHHPCILRKLRCDNSCPYWK